MLKSKFLAYWEDSEWRQKILIYAIMLMSITFVVLSVIIFRLIGASRTVIMPPSLEETVWVSGEAASKEYLRRMADYVSQQIMEFTPADIDRRKKNILFYVQTQNFKDMDAKLDSWKTMVLSGGLSQTFRPDKFNITENKIIVGGHLVRSMKQDTVWDHEGELEMEYTIDGGRFYLRGFKIFTRLDSGKKPPVPVAAPVPAK